MGEPFDLRAEFERWEFTMPGHRLQLHIPGDDRPGAPAAMAALRMLPVVRVVVTTRDSYDPTKDLQVAHQFTVPPYIDSAEALGGFLRHRIHQVMCHEADEWLRWDGRIAFDPHAGETSPPRMVAPL